MKRRLLLVCLALAYFAGVEEGGQLIVQLGLQPPVTIFGLAVDMIVWHFELVLITSLLVFGSAFAILRGITGAEFLWIVSLAMAFQSVVLVLAWFASVSDALYAGTKLLITVLGPWVLIRIWRSFRPIAAPS